jgi:hypothetical protein
VHLFDQDDVDDGEKEGSVVGVCREVNVICLVISSEYGVGILTFGKNVKVRASDLCM